MADYPVIDADGHVLEAMDDIKKYLEPRWQHRERLFSTDAWDRSIRGKLGYHPRTPQDHLDAMDKDGVDVMVLFPTTYLSVGLLREPEFATALTRAYNSWLHDYCQANPARLKFAALIAPQDVKEAAQELRRAVTELGAVGAMLPSYIPQRPDWGHPYYDPIYATAQELDVGLGFHATVQESIGATRFNNFINVHTVAHPFEQMISVCAVIVGGVLDRFPSLRVAFLESGIGWVPYWMDRLDEEIEKRGAVEAPWLKAKPSEYLTSGRCYFGIECEEKTIPDAIPTTGDDILLFATDYPHWDTDWPGTVERVLRRQDISESTKRKILHDNAARFWKIKVPVRV